MSSSAAAAAAVSTSTTNPTYSALAALRDKLRNAKITDRRLVAKELLNKLHDTSTLRNLEWEAQHVFACAVERLSNTAGAGAGGRETPTFPWDRVCILYRNLMDTALLSSRTTIDGDSNNSSSSGKKRNHANQTGFR